MQYRRFGRTDFQISVFSLGTMRCLSSGANLEQTLSHALDLGINHIETAQGYGASEGYLGQALAALSRERDLSQLFITTKITPQPSADAMAAAIDTSLRRLGRSCVQGLALHGINTPQHLAWILDPHGCMAAVRQAVTEGKVQHVGFSTHAPLDLILSCMASQQFEFVCLHYNLFFQRNLPALLAAQQQDLGVFIISPADKGGRLYQPSDRLKQLCHPIEPLRLNSRFLLSQAAVSTLSVGPATPQELDWPLSVADDCGPLTSVERHCLLALDQAADAVLGGDRCQQCYGCLPCPEEIQIPEVLRLRNLSLAYEMQSYAQYRYGMFEHAGHWFPGRKAIHCTHCGDCLPRCPYDLAIADLVHDAHQRLQVRERRRLWADDP
ncbi:aldo/keto reductase [Lyngbya confervoides]|uniref:Aldo/keto reductase n=1 Tax=Lyngbya confervoides BDU141951 TaxID=1574623 RepID=A0ABD4T9W2_9CYAN|nr:aldo/keto reductase [Lyngbya confervoides]MCM1985228.1 aldo/keto reductase [Lyngbya confervoides BDU141951]